MAEYVKWRLTRMRTGVTMALFGLLAGLGLRVRESEPATFERAAGLIQGHGSVLTGEVVPSPTGPSVLTVPGTLTVQGTKDAGAPNTIIAVLNTSDQTLFVNHGDATDSVPPGKTFTDTGFADGSV